MSEDLQREPITQGMSGLYEGFIEPDSACTKVIDELVKAIRDPEGFLPQKYLYASLTGARLWHELCIGVPVNNHIAEVYKRFPLGTWQGQSLTDIFETQTKACLSKVPDKSKGMGLIALGAGTGFREAKVSDWLVNTHQLHLLETYLVDVSSELLGESLKQFHALGDRVSPKFAILDFESARGHAQLIELRSRLGELPTVFLFLGNTFGNISQNSFVSLLADVMQPQDLLLCESLLATDAETQLDGRHTGGTSTIQVAFEAKHDPRSQFMVNPLRSLGFNPKFQNLQKWVTRSAGKWRRDEYRYEFDADECRLAPQLSRFEPTGNRLSIGDSNWIGLLKIQAVTPTWIEPLFKNAFDGFQLVQHLYSLKGPPNREVRMGYCFASNPKRQPLMIEESASPQTQAMSFANLIQFCSAECSLRIDDTNPISFHTLSHYAVVRALVLSSNDLGQKNFSLLVKKVRNELEVLKSLSTTNSNITFNQNAQATLNKLGADDQESAQAVGKILHVLRTRAEIGIREQKPAFSKLLAILPVSHSVKPRLEGRTWRDVESLGDSDPLPTR